MYLLHVFKPTFSVFWKLIEKLALLVIYFKDLVHASS